MSSIRNRVFNSDLSQESCEATCPRQFSLKNFAFYPKLENNLRDVAILRIGSDMLKSLLAMRQNEAIDARNRIDIPHGLFGLSFDQFEARLEENTVYIDVLQLVCQYTLEQARICIVLDDLQQFVRRLFLGYHSETTEPILKDIRNSEKLLTINQTIANDFSKNSQALMKIQDKLNAFKVREKNANLYVNNQVNAALSACAETETVVDPIEYRYRINFYHNTAEQLLEKSRQVHKSFEQTLQDLEKAQSRENIVTDCVQLKQRLDIEILKSKLEEMTEKYERETEHLDTQISKKTNAIEALSNLHSDCVAKMEFYSTDIVRLKEWREKWEQKKMEKVVAVMEETKSAKVIKMKRNQKKKNRK